MQIKTPDCVSSSLTRCVLSFFSWLSTVSWAPSSPRYKLQSSAPAGRREKGVEANPSEELVTTLWAKLTEWRGVLSKEKSRSTVKPVSPSSRSFLATDFLSLPPSLFPFSPLLYFSPSFFPSLECTVSYVRLFAVSSNPSEAKVSYRFVARRGEREIE